MPDNPNVYLQTFTDYKMAEARFSAAVRAVRENRATNRTVTFELEAAQQAYRAKAAELAVIAERLGVKPLGGCQARLLVGVG